MWKQVHVTIIIIKSNFDESLDKKEAETLKGESLHKKEAMNLWNTVKKNPEVFSQESHFYMLISRESVQLKRNKKLIFRNDC